MNQQLINVDYDRWQIGSIEPYDNEDPMFTSLEAAREAAHLEHTKDERPQTVWLFRPGFVPEVVGAWIAGKWLEG